jgi:hypothetical protein
MPRRPQHSYVDDFVSQLGGRPRQQPAERSCHAFASPDGLTSLRNQVEPFAVLPSIVESEDYRRGWNSRLAAHTARTHASASSETGTGAIAASPGYSERTSSFSATSRASAAWRPISKARRASATFTRDGPGVPSVTCSTSSGIDLATSPPTGTTNDASSRRSTSDRLPLQTTPVREHVHLVSGHRNPPPEHTSRDQTYRYVRSTHCLTFCLLMRRTRHAVMRLARADHRDKLSYTFTSDRGVGDADCSGRSSSRYWGTRGP